MDKFVDINPLLKGTGVPPAKRAPFFEKAAFYLRRLWAETCYELRNDLRFSKPTNWRRTAAVYSVWILFTLWVLGLLACCFFVPFYVGMNEISAGDVLWEYCAPDGSFSLEPTNPWKPQWAFQITLAFGSLTFTQAKAIDIVWDIVSCPYTSALTKD